MDPWSRSFLVVTLLGSLGVVAAQAPVRREVVVMGALLVVEVEAGSRAVALRASEAAVRAVEAVDRRLSVWRDDSDVSRINAGRIGEAIAVDPATVADLTWAFALAQRAGGAFEPSAGPLVLAYGLRAEPRWPGAPDLLRAMAAVGTWHYRLGAAAVERLAPDAALDCDAFGKGIGLDRALEAAVAAGARRAWFDFGGQVLHGGERATAIEVAIADTDDRTRIVAVLRLPADRSAATSGNGERRTAPLGRTLGHLLDPRTGAPAADFGSVTVVAESAALADAAATALFVLGPDDGLALAPRLGVEAMFVLRGAAAGDPPQFVATPGLSWRRTDAHD